MSRINNDIAPRFRRVTLRLARHLHRRLASLHRDERGTISILTVIVLLGFVMVLGMIVNVGRSVDDKIRRQNAADAGTYSFGVVMARGMNAIAFTNHMLSETFAMTAYLREGRDRNAEQYVPQVLAAWDKIGPIFARSQFAKFAQLGPAINEKSPLEQEAVTAFGEMTAIKARIMLPALEYILGEPGPQGNPTTHLIPEFQRAVILNTPIAAVATMREIVARHCPAGQGERQVAMAGSMFRPQDDAGASGGTIDNRDPLLRALPAVDPSATGSDISYLPANQVQIYRNEAIRRRRELAHHYLGMWESDPEFDLAPFEREYFYYPDGDTYIVDPHNGGGRVSAKQSRFKQLWHSFTCGQLEQLLNLDYPLTNLPHMIRLSENGQWPQQESGQGMQDLLEYEYTMLGVMYWPRRDLSLPGLFKSIVDWDTQTYAQVQLMVPQPRYLWINGKWTHTVYGGSSLSPNANGTFTLTFNNPQEVPNFDNWPTQWDLFNQNWMVQMVPATSDSWPTTLSRVPSADVIADYTPPDLNGISATDLKRVTTH